MTDHAREAERLLGGDESDQRAAQVHAILALVPLLREIGDQLDTLHLRLSRCDEVDRLGQHCVLRPGHEGLHRAGRPLDVPMEVRA